MNSFFRFPLKPGHHGMNPFTLQFKGEMEERFQDEYIKTNISFIRFAGIMGCFMWFIFGLSDLLWAQSDLLIRAWTVRFIYIMPFLLLMLISAFRQQWYRAVPFLYSLGLVSISVGMLLLDRLNPIQDLYTLKVSNLLLTMVGYTFMRLRFKFGIFIGFSIMMLTLLNAIILSLPTGMLIYDLAILLCTNFFGGFAGYALEFYSRHDFFHKVKQEKQQLLEIEAENLRTAQDMARTVAHEFNNPISIIKLTYELHLEKIKQHLTPESVRQFEKIVVMADRMNDLVQKLLDLTRITKDETLGGSPLVDLKASSDPQSQKDT